MGNDKSAPPPFSPFFFYHTLTNIHNWPQAGGPRLFAEAKEERFPGIAAVAPVELKRVPAALYGRAATMRLSSSLIVSATNKKRGEGALAWGLTHIFLGE